MTQAASWVDYMQNLMLGFIHFVRFIIPRLGSFHVYELVAASFTKVDRNSLKSFKFSAALRAEKGACFSYGCAPRLQRSDKPWAPLAFLN